MKTYEGIVCVSYYQKITVKAHSIDEAKATMCDLFDLDKADCGDPEVYDIAEAEEERA